MSPLILGITMFLIPCVYCGLICREEVPETPFWEAPCGTKISNTDYDEVPKTIKRDMVMKSMRTIKQSLRICLYFYKAQNFSAIYTIHNSAPESETWLREKTTFDTKIEHIHEVPEIIKKLFTSLQIFGMAFDQILKEESEMAKKKSIERIILDLKSLLCDVQSNLIWLQVKVPSTTEKLPEDYKKKEETYRIYRDNETLKKYSQHLRGFLKFIRNTKKRFRRNKQDKNVRKKE